MNVFVKSLCAVVAVAMTCAGCSKDQNMAVAPQEEPIELTLVADRVAPEASRTEYDQSFNNIKWSSDDRASLWSNGKDKGAKVAQLKGDVASFVIQITKGNNKIQGFVPADAHWGEMPHVAELSENSAVGITAFGLTLPARQIMPSANTFDKAADILMLQNVAYYAVIDKLKCEVVPVRFGRVVALTQFTFKNIPAEGEEVLSAMVEVVNPAAPKSIAGQFYFNPTTGFYCNQTGAQLDERTNGFVKGVSSITINLPDGTRVKDGAVSAWCGMAPITLSAGDQLVLTLFMSDKKLVRKIDINADKVFTNKALNKVGVNMAQAEVSATDAQVQFNFSTQHPSHAIYDNDTNPQIAVLVDQAAEFDSSSHHYVLAPGNSLVIEGKQIKKITFDGEIVSANTAGAIHPSTGNFAACAGRGVSTWTAAEPVHRIVFTPDANTQWHLGGMVKVYFEDQTKTVFTPVFTIPASLRFKDAKSDVAPAKTFTANVLHNPDHLPLEADPTEHFDVAVEGRSITVIPKNRVTTEVADEEMTFRIGATKQIVRLSQKMFQSSEVITPADLRATLGLTGSDTYFVSHDEVITAGDCGFTFGYGPFKDHSSISETQLCFEKGDFMTISSLSGTVLKKIEFIIVSRKNYKIHPTVNGLMNGSCTPLRDKMITWTADAKKPVSEINFKTDGTNRIMQITVYY